MIRQQRQQNFRFFFTIFAIFCLGCSCVSAEESATQPRHWRVVWSDDPSTSARVLWNTMTPGKQHLLRWRETGSEDEPNGRAADSERFLGGSNELYSHAVELSDLKPATSYDVQMESDGNRSDWFYFVTAPDDDRPLALIHGGDSRSDSAMRRRMNKMIAGLVEESFENDDPDDDIVGFAHGGDYIVSGRNLGQWTQWMEDHEQTTCRDGRLTPIIPAIGNHDKGPIYNQVFGFPEDDKNYYAVNLSSEVRFITLNSEISTAGAQAKWLQEELAASRPSHRWLLVQYHRPVFPAVKSPGSGLLSWVPLFEQYNVDLVCESDGHVAKRTVPIRDGEHDPSGIVYIGEGGLGVPQRTPKKDRWYLQEPGMADAAHHVFIITLGESEMGVHCHTLTGGVIDEYTQPVRR